MLHNNNFVFYSLARVINNQYQIAVHLLWLVVYKEWTAREKTRNLVKFESKRN